jgi:acyl-CoA thioester hydrolase
MHAGLCALLQWRPTMHNGQTMYLLPIPDRGLVIDETAVVPEWIDYNGHMNVAYYIKAFEIGIDSYKAVVGLTLDYIERTGRSTVALESHVTYQQEAHLGERLRIETRILDCDGKRVHVYQEIYRDTALLATQETLAISFDTGARRASPFAPEVAANYQRLIAAQAAQPRPPWVGRAISINARRPQG